MSRLFIFLIPALMFFPCEGSSQVSEGYDLVYTVGDNNVALELVNESFWQPAFQGGVETTLKAVWVSPTGSAYAVGDFGVIIRVTEEECTHLSSGTTSHLLDIWGFSSSTIYAVGASGTILRYNGLDWMGVASGTTSYLRSVWGLSPDNIYAGGDGGLILHYDGSSWSEVFSNPAAGAIRAIWGIAPDDIYAFGNNASYHYDGMSWNEITVPTTNIWGAWGTASDDIYVCCSAGIYHYNGTMWSEMNSCGISYMDIWGFGSDDIHAVSTSIPICHYDGSNWTAPESPWEGPLYGVHGISADDVWAVGSEGIVLHFDGTQWTTILGNLPVCDFLRIWGSASDNIYITGCEYELIHFDGTSWEKMEIPGVGTELGHLEAIDGTGADNIYVNRNYSEYDGSHMHLGSYVYHFDGITWNVLPGLSCNLIDIWADPASGLYGISTCWNPVDRIYTWSACSYNDGTWSSESLQVGYPVEQDVYYRIHGRGEDRPVITGWWAHPIAGSGGVIHEKNNSTWGYIPEDRTCDWYTQCPTWSTVWHAVYCVSENEIWFAGENGAVMWWRPEIYIEFNLNLGVTLHALWASPSGNVYAAGDNGTIAFWNGSSWQEMYSGTSEDLNDIWGCRPGTSTGIEPVPEAIGIGLSNYPNPFNPSTTITYSVPSRGPVILKIFDVTGKLVKNLLSGTKEPGTYTAHWDGTNEQGHRVASGTYFCRLITDAKAVTRKIVLAR